VSDAVVIGIGSPDGGDDAAGLEVARRLGDLEGAVVVESTGDPLELIDAWDGAGLAVVVDAVRSGSTAGTIHGLNPFLGHLSRPGSSHALSLPEAFGVASALGRLPEWLALLGIEGRRFEVGAPVTPEVADAVLRCAEVVRGLVRDPSAVPRVAAARPPRG
jgi:hydrogenase maturation protease